MAKNTPIGPGTRVTLRFTLALTSGDIVDSTGDTAATFVVGDGNLLPGFEQRDVRHVGRSLSAIIDSS